jgi:DNA-binding HxlR family transcriptional regulator
MHKNALSGYTVTLWKPRFVQPHNELRRLMPDISHKVLTETLRNLEDEGPVIRTVYAEVPPRVESCISPHKESARPLIGAVRAWGREHLDWKHLEWKQQGR